jgi:hypothetical protein
MAEDQAGGTEAEARDGKVQAMRRRILGNKQIEKDIGGIRVLTNLAPVTPTTPTDHGTLSGLGDDDHSQYVHISAGRTITAQHSFAPASAMPPYTLGANAQGQTVTGLKADQLNKSISAGTGMTGGGALTADRTLSVNLAYAFSWGALHTFNSGIYINAGNLKIDDYVESDLLPAATDTYDLGSWSRLWRKGWLSELDTILFAQNTITLLGGWFYVTPDAGSLPADVTSIATQIDFGKAMTPGDFVIFRISLQLEYMTVGSLVSGTTYNVTRNVDGSGANSWPQGSAFAVLGQSGDGRVEIYAYSGAPAVSIYEQGATYNAQTLMVRLGNMRGEYSTGAIDRYGIGIGDYSLGEYLSYNAETADGLVIKTAGAHISFTPTGMSIDASTNRYSKITWVVSTPSVDMANIFCNTTGSTPNRYGQLYLTAFNEGAGSEPYVYLDADPAGAQIRLMNAPVDVQYDLSVGSGLYVGSTGQVVDTGDAIITGGLTVGATTNPPTGRILVPGQGSSYGILLGGDAHLYRDAADQLRTPDQLVVDSDLRPQADLYTIAWSNYSVTESGWSSLTTALIYYKKVGKTVYVWFHVSGTADAAATNFNLPYSNQGSIQMNFACQILSGGSWFIGVGSVAASGNTVGFYNPDGTNLASSGTKTVVGQFVYHTA